MDGYRNNKVITSLRFITLSPYVGIMARVTNSKRRVEVGMFNEERKKDQNVSSSPSACSGTSNPSSVMYRIF